MFSYQTLMSVYRGGARLLAPPQSLMSTLWVIVLGFLLGVIGYVPLSSVVIGWSIYTWLFALWDASLRKQSGHHFGMTVLLMMMFFAATVAKTNPH